MYHDSLIQRYILLYVIQISSGSLRYDAGNPKPVLYDNLKGWGAEGGGRGVQEGRNTCTPMANSC